MPNVFFLIRHALLALQEWSAHPHLVQAAQSAGQDIINHAQDQAIVACAIQIPLSPATNQLNVSHVLQGQLRMAMQAALIPLNVFAALVAIT